MWSSFYFSISIFEVMKVTQQMTTKAPCFNKMMNSAIQLMLIQDFDAFEDDCSDGVCQDIDGRKTHY